jgi:hypothetical protein
MRPPFSWLCHQEPLTWLGDQIVGSVIPLHAHGHNRPARDETPYPSTSTSSVYVSYGSSFFTEKLFIAFLGIRGRSISKVSTLAFNFFQLLLPSGPLAPSSHKVRYNLQPFIV